jgi:SAM-dependent methyltransferase
MTFLNKFGIGPTTGRESSRTVTAPGNDGRGHTAAPAAIAAVGPNKNPEKSESSRVSNGLKELLWNLEGLGHGTLLDLGSVWQTTLSFFIERGFRVTSEDILRAWKDFLDKEESALREATRSPETPIDVTPSGRAGRFLEANLQYPIGSFDAVLLWDLLDYFEPSMAAKTVASITELLRPGGVVFAMFHSKKPEGFQRYRVVDSSNLQVVSTKVLCPAQRVYQNREIQDLFARYRTMKSFVGRDQLRESLFIK